MELFDVAARVPVSGRRVLVSIVGNRFRQHLEAQVQGMLSHFDDIYLSQDEAYFQKNAQGFDPQDPLGGMLAHARAIMLPKMKEGQHLIVDRAFQALLERSLTSLRPGDFVVILAEPIDAMRAIDKYRQQRLGKLDVH